MVLPVPVEPAKPTLWPCSICGIASACTAVGCGRPSDSVAAHASGESWSDDQAEVQRRAVVDGSLAAAPPPLSKLRGADSRAAASRMLGLLPSAVLAKLGMVLCPFCLRAGD